MYSRVLSYTEQAIANARSIIASIQLLMTPDYGSNLLEPDDTRVYLSGSSEPGDIYGYPGYNDQSTGIYMTDRVASSVIATTIPYLLNKTNRDVLNRARRITVSISRVDKRNSMWIFRAGDYRVWLKIAKPPAKSDKVWEADIQVKCTCNAWKFNGSEHWAVVGRYLFGRPFGTATRPVHTDPHMKNMICKHVAAVFLKSKDYFIPEK